MKAAIASGPNPNTHATVSAASGVVILFLCSMLLLAPGANHADTPLGWINAGNPSAYTTTAGEFEINVSGLAVNDSIDFLNIRDDLLSSTQKLVGDSGDLLGAKLELHYGISSDLSVFYRLQVQDLTVDLGSINSVNLIDIDKELATRMQSAGLKWTFYRANLLNSDNRQTAASLELSAFSNKSNDFDVVLDEIRLPNLTVFFRDPQTFSIASLEDEGWKARLALSWNLGRLGIGTFWAAYGESRASSATTSDLTTPAIAALFEQEFELREHYLFLGASINLQLTPRLPLIVSYEYINVTSSNFERNPIIPPAGLPGFLTSANPAAEDTNHTLNARLSYWLTPQLSLSLTGNLYSNQFLGVVPHYNNPLSGSFASYSYGYAGVELGYKL